MKKEELDAIKSHPLNVPMSNVRFGCAYDQEDPGWYLYNGTTGRVIVSAMEGAPTEEELDTIKRSRTLTDIYNLIQRDQIAAKTE